MPRAMYEYATKANLELITEVAKCYNDASENIKFYAEVNSPTLQKMAQEHMMHWKKELRKLIFHGLNCPDERNRDVK